MHRLFGTDGIRGVANASLTCEVALAVGRALGHVIMPRGEQRCRVVIGRDTRASSDSLELAISAGLCSVGCDVLSLGVIPTGAVAQLTVKYSASAGVMISASHNPFEYNGIKIFGEDGFKLSDELEAKIEELVFEKRTDALTKIGREVGNYYVAKTSREDYLEGLCSALCTDISGLKIAVDCANGAASGIADTLFNSLGVEIHPIACAPSGDNINEGCGSTHTEQIQKYVKEHTLDAGFALDGDADRCIAIDEEGREIDGDYILAILAADMKERGELKKNTVVGTVLSNYGLIKFLRDEGIDFVGAKVGDKYVLELINQDGLSLGGEGSGHIIFRDYMTTGDGLFTALQLLAIMKRKNMPLSKLSAVMKKYPQFTVNIEAGEEEKLLLFTDSQIKAKIKAAEEKVGDGGRILVRPSGTEPLIRVMAEGQDPSAVEKLARSLAADIKKSLKKG